MIKSQFDILLDALEYVKFKDADIGMAFNKAIKAVAKDMSFLEYEPSNDASSYLDALALCLRDYKEGIVKMAETEALLYESIDNRIAREEIRLAEEDDDK